MVWFKRDLRCHDHAPLAAAAAQCARATASSKQPGALLPLYVIEPSLWQAADADLQHWQWLHGALRELADGLAARGAPLLVRTGDVVAVLDAIRRGPGITALHSHQETGTAIGYARDRAVARFCRTHGIAWTEHRQFGVLRGPVDRDRWSRQWEALMAEAEHTVPAWLPGAAPIRGLPCESLPDRPIPTLSARHPAVSERDWQLQSGEQAARCRLETFLDVRGARYHREMSSPATAFDACSRLSADLACGALSLRHVVQRTRAAQRTLREQDGHTERGQPFARGALAAFASRLHWHCHFIQKLESEPALEARCFNRALDAVRPRPGDPRHLEAWQTGRTGLPFLDACMRALQTRGWINFRMRAMLVSFAAYQLWLDWREFRDFLARQFVDYEPGIHISQIQMQSGVTGINTLRIYNPVKQGLDQDPEGAFIRRWVPELAGLEGRDLHEPWKAAPMLLTAAGVRLGDSYPERIVDHEQAAREARAKLALALATPAARAESVRVMAEHGSRRSPDRRRARRRGASGRRAAAAD